MGRWAKRILVIVFLMAWLLILLTPTMAVVLARNGQVQFGPSDGPHTRVFMLQEARSEGIALERTRKVRSPEQSEGATSCLRTTVRYWMWTPGVENQNADYCQCTDTATGDVIGAVSPSCELP